MSCSVIVAEDEVLLLENIVKKINRYSPDFKVVGSAQTGIEAYALIEELCPDILITDIRMPAMDGLELIKKVHENYPYIDCIIVTGYSDFSYAKKAIHYQVREYLLKPLEDEQLHDTLYALRNEFISRTHNYNEIFGSDLSVQQQPDIPCVLKNYILNHYNEDIKLNAIASTMHYSSSYLTKVFSQEYGCSPSKYIISVRIQNAQQLLKHNHDLSVKQIGEAVGYPEPGYFSRVFKKQTGVSPLEYRSEDSQN
jgi:YesN/AraC family two-component response regulator